MTDIRLLYVTIKDASRARALATELLERRLIACANILPQMESVYRWKGSVQTETETVVILKTEARLVPEAMRAIQSLHDYETPCILSLSIDSGAPEYLAWLKSETAAAQ